MTRRPDTVPDFPDDARLIQSRRLLVSAVFLVVLLSPAIRVLSDHGMPAAARWFLLGGSIVFLIVTYLCWLSPSVPGAAGVRPVPGVAVTAIVALAVALFAVGGLNWLAVLAVGAAVAGQFGRTTWPAMLGPMAAFFAYGSRRRADAVNALRRARADLARTAVAEERLRIARDVHDLLGHSLSLITLKAELAGRVIGADQDRAAAEIAELESVARQSLADVRAAVAGYRQPDLAAELDSARQLLDSAGIACDISAAGTAGLSHDVDAALAWAVREGTTNVVRHSQATRVAISVSKGPATAGAEVSDNGPADDGGPGARLRLPAGQVHPDRPDVGGRVSVGGSGLAGLAERVHGLGGELVAGTVAPRGFRLRVVVPLGPPL
jgi:two-component system, NarL family, sensor histidine kinase DesK